MDQIQEGFALMGVGMGVVFAFLILLVLLLNISTKIFERFGHLFPDHHETEPAFEDEDHSADIAVAVAAAARARDIARG